MAELRQAIERNELVFFYQPKINFQTNRLEGVEALIRWQHPERGLILPDQFITAAEETGLIKPLAEWELKTALSQCRLWHQGGLEFQVSVNLSVRNLHDSMLPEQVLRLLSICEVAGTSLMVEITETAIMLDPLRAKETLTNLKTMGVQCSIDDFGTGYSSLSQLRKLPVDEIKIDKSFVMNMATNPNDAAIVRSTIDLAHDLGLRVVAEGVETREVWEALKAFGCDVAQGYYVSRPLPSLEWSAWMEGWLSRSISPAKPVNGADK